MDLTFIMSQFSVLWSQEKEEARGRGLDNGAEGREKCKVSFELLTDSFAAN